MIAFRIHKTPADFPFKDAWKLTWTVVTLIPLDGSRTHVRAASLGTEPIRNRRRCGVSLSAATTRRSRRWHLISSGGEATKGNGAAEVFVTRQGHLNMRSVLSYVGLGDRMRGEPGGRPRAMGSSPQRSMAWRSMRNVTQRLPRLIIRSLPMTRLALRQRSN